MSVDLSTKYLGLSLKNPLVVAACSLTDAVGQPPPAGSKPAPPRSSCTRCSKSRSRTTRRRSARSTSTAPIVTPRPSPTSPKWRTTTSGRTSYLEHIAQAKKAVTDPRHRQP